jgi:integrase
MANSIKVLFWLRRTKVNNEGVVPLMLRITYQNKKAEKATGYYVKPDDWNIAKQKLIRGKDVAKQINQWMDETTVKIADLFRKESQKNNVHLPTIIAKLFSVATEEPQLLNTIIEYNNYIKNRVGKDFSFSTYEKYVFTYNKVKAFIEQFLKKKDVLIRDLDVKFIMDFDNYLRVNDNNQHNTAVKYCINLKRIINVLVLQGILTNNPFKNYKTVYRDTMQVYLEQAELNAVVNIQLVKPSHLLVRDLFLFQCYTGLAYTDLVNLTITDISVDPSGRRWIIKRRQKTGIVSTIPLLPQSIELIEKYSFYRLSNIGMLPYYSIQKYNQYIGEVGKLAGINKKLSSHVGRRTFGNVALAKGISLNVISKILGHSNTLITQRIYAITTQNIITKEIEKW